MMPPEPEMRLCRVCGMKLNYTIHAYAFQDKDHVHDSCRNAIANPPDVRDGITSNTQALVDCLDLMYNTVTQDIRDKFASTMQSIRNELLANNRLELVKKLHARTMVLSKIANKNPQFLNGASNYVKGFKEMKSMARKAIK